MSRPPLPQNVKLKARVRQADSTKLESALQEVFDGQENLMAIHQEESIDGNPVQYVLVSVATVLPEVPQPEEKRIIPATGLRLVETTPD